MSKLVSAEDFVRAWNGATSQAEVMEALGMTRSAVATRACNYRRRGIELRLFPRKDSRAPLDVAKLNEIARETLGETE